MGRGMFGGGPGPWPEDPPWDGWWGESPPFHMPVFVLTHHEREPLELSDTTFHFVTDGDRVGARAGQGGGRRARTSLLGGGADDRQQYLAAGLVDEMQLNLVPVLLGGGERLFDNLGDAVAGFEQVGRSRRPGVTHLTYAPT